MVNQEAQDHDREDGQVRSESEDELLGNDREEAGQNAADPMDCASPRR